MASTIYQERKADTTGTQATAHRERLIDLSGTATQSRLVDLPSKRRDQPRLNYLTYL